MATLDAESQYQSMTVDDHDSNATLSNVREDITTNPGPVTTEHRVDAPTLTSMQTSNSTCNRQLTGEIITEILFCTALITIAIIPRLSGVLRVNERPIPYQILDNGEYVRDLTIDQQLVGETISDSLVVILALLIPLLLQLALSWKFGTKGDIHGTVCVYIVSFCLVSIATDFVKTYVGYLRPVFYELCQPNDTYDTCTTDLSEENSGRKSFPSGHASTAFCGLTLLTLFLHNRFGIPSIKTYATIIPSTVVSEPNEMTVTYKRNPLRYRIYSILSLLPMAIALFIAASRVHDNRHFPADVVAGSILGGTISMFVHNLWM
jgi:diacylglycerol diphosphate phosphatase / phosphatidate phosphatase